MSCFHMIACRNLVAYAPPFILMRGQFGYPVLVLRVTLAHAQPAAMNTYVGRRRMLWLAFCETNPRSKWKDTRAIFPRLECGVGLSLKHTTSLWLLGERRHAFYHPHGIVYVTDHSNITGNSETQGITRCGIYCSFFHFLFQSPFQR